MGAFLAYSIINGLLLSVLYLSYRVLLARENQPRFNRGVLLAIYAVSFLAPLLMSAFEELPRHAAPALTTFNGLKIVGGIAATANSSLWATALIWLFIVGMAAVGARTLITWIRLGAVVRFGRKIEKDGYTLVLTGNDKFAPFSWRRYVVMSEKDYENNYAAIAAHELKHIAARHRIDLLIAQAACMVNWFNPVAWLMRDDLMLVHEYQADLAVIESGYDIQAYQRLLIKKAVGARFPSLANSLNHSKLKKRITMMYKEKSGAGRKLKALALVPMLSLALGVASVPAVRAAVSTIGSSDISVGKSSEKLPDDKIKVQRYRVTDISVNAQSKHTTVTVTGENFGNTLTVSGATLKVGHKTYRENSMHTSLTNGAAVITASFPVAAADKKPSAMTLTVNGLEIPFNLEEFSSLKAVSAPTGNKKIFVNGKEVTEAEMNAISPDNIISMTVNRQSNSIFITSK